MGTGECALWVASGAAPASAEVLALEWFRGVRGDARPDFLR